MVNARKVIRSLKNTLHQKLLMMVEIKRGHCTPRSTVLAAPPAMVKDKNGEGGQSAVGLDPIYDGAVMACRRTKSQDVIAVTWNVSSWYVDLRRWWRLYTEKNIGLYCSQETDGRVKVRGCMVLLVEDTSSFCQYVIRGLLVVVCLLLRNRLPALSMWSDSVSGSYDMKLMTVNIVSAYAPRVDLSAEEKDDFLDSFYIVFP